MTELDIIKHLAGSLDHRKYPYQLPRAFIYGWECDYWAMDTHGCTREFEIKISVADFRNDAKKNKHSVNIGANYFYYVCPFGLIQPADIDKKYGLIYVNTFGSTSIVKKPKKLNDRVFDDWKMLANKMYWKWYGLWRQKLIDKEITRDQYWQGYEFDLQEPLTVDPTP